MAWTEQCKIAFEVSCEGLLAKQKNKKKNLSEVFKLLAEQSGIPQKTLSRWWYEKQREKEKFERDLLRIEQSQQATENTPENETISDQEIIPICQRCADKQVYIRPDTGKPCGKASIYYGLCGGCRGKQMKAIASDKKSDPETAIETYCPECGYQFFVNKETRNIYGRGSK